MLWGSNNAADAHSDVVFRQRHLVTVAKFGIVLSSVSGWCSWGFRMATAKNLGLNVFIPTPHAHWTPRYLVSRIRQEWWSRSHPDDPWLTRTAVAFLNEYLRPGDTVVEFGSGRSTMWFSRHVGAMGKVISVEASQEWQQEVVRRLHAAGMGQADVQYAPDTPEQYVRSAAQRLIGKADAILIDGSVRDACAVWAVTAVKPGGIIVLDNAQHYLPHESRCPRAIPEHGNPKTPLWAEFASATANWRRYWTTDGVNDTAVFFAPVV